MSILVIGGAGYIGSHMSKVLVKNGFHVVIVDDLSTGFESLAQYGDLVVGDFSDAQLMDQVFTDYQIEAVMHFAARSIVGESVRDPFIYYTNNVSNVLLLLKQMLNHGIDKFIFSSTAATFGNPKSALIDETHTQFPINPYGHSKLMVETILKDFAPAYRLNSISLRYFNACGADPSGGIGELHNPETHLIPLILQAASGRRNNISIFGDNYLTRDGTCVRDYVHVNDLCSAHYNALDKILKSTDQPSALFYNLGNGLGFSVKEVVDAAREIVSLDGCEIDVVYDQPRAGDPAILVADSSLASRELSWKAKYIKLSDIISHAWQWEKKVSGLSQT